MSQKLGVRLKQTFEKWNEETITDTDIHVHQNHKEIKHPNDKNKFRQIRS